MTLGVRIQEQSMTTKSEHWARCDMGDKTRNPTEKRVGDSEPPHAE